MEDSGTFCTDHPEEPIRLICTEADCKDQTLCLKCTPNHLKHGVMDIKQFWNRKLRNTDYSNNEQSIRKSMKDPYNQEEGAILMMCMDIKTHILNWGRDLELQMNRSIDDQVKSMIRFVNKHEENMVKNIHEKSTDLNQIIENAGVCNEYKRKIKYTVKLSQFNKAESHYLDWTEKLKSVDEEIQKLFLKPKKIDIKVIVNDIQNKATEQAQSLIQKLNKLVAKHLADLNIICDRKYKVKRKKISNKIVPKKKESGEIDQIISASYDKSLIFWDKDFEVITRHSGKAGYMKLVELKGGKFAVGKWNGEVEIFDTNSRQLVSTLIGHKKSVWGLCGCSINNLADQNTIITGGADDTIRIWNLSNSKEYTTCSSDNQLEGHKNDILCVLVHQDEYLLSGSVDSTVRVWELGREFKFLFQIKHKSAQVNDLVEVKGGVLSICSHDVKLGSKMWKLGGKGKPKILGEVPPPPEEGRGFVCGLGIEGGRRVLLGGTQGGLMGVDTETWHILPVFTHKIHTKYIYQIRKLNEAEYITGSNDATIKVINIYSQVILRTLEQHQSGVISILPIFVQEEEI